MRNAFAVAAFALGLFVAGCSGGSSGPVTGGDPPPPSCLPTISTCTASAECCGTCLMGYCMPSPKGGKCVTTDDCADTTTVCVNRICTVASCRQDADVCTLDTQCCGGNCRPNETCGPNRAPVADLGADRTIDVGILVELGRTGVGDPDGDPVTYSWTLARPAGSAAALSSTTAWMPTFRPDKPGAYTVSVTVSDGTLSASDSVVLTAVNTAPIASAGANRSAPRNTLVQLDASASSDLNGDPLTFSWTLAGPPGSAATLSPAADPRPSFTPDLLGDYLATVTVGDGTTTSSATVTITATNTAPVARVAGLTAVNAGESVALSAATSTDENGDPLTFTWAVSGPYGSVATPTPAVGTGTTLTPDLPGSYRVTVTASDGLATHSASLYVQAHGHLIKLTHDVVAATYSKATDRLVMVSTTPSHALWILDPATETEQSVALTQGPPLSVGVSADGLVAVVGRNGGITQIDLATRTEMSDCVTQWTDSYAVPPATWNYDAAHVAVSPPRTVGTGKSAHTTRFAYAAPGTATYRGNYVMGLDLATCAQTANWVLSANSVITATTRPGNGDFWVHEADYGGAYFIHPVPTGPLVSYIWAEAADGGATRAGFWFMEDGARFVVEYGDVYDPTPGTSAYLQKPLTRLGSLGNPALYDPQQLVTHADHSAVREAISIVPMNDWDETTADTVLKRFWARAATPSSYATDGAPVPLPSIVVDGLLHEPHGRYVFYRSDGSVRYAVIQPPAGDVLQLVAVAPMAP